MTSAYCRKTRATAETRTAIQQRGVRTAVDCLRCCLLARRYQAPSVDAHKDDRGTFPAAQLAVPYSRGTTFGILVCPFLGLLGLGGLLLNVCPWRCCPPGLGKAPSRRLLDQSARPVRVSDHPARYASARCSRLTITASARELRQSGTLGWSLLIRAI